MQQLARENRSLAERIGQWIKDFVSRLKAAFKGVEARHEEARILMRHAEDMQKMWDRALVQAVHSRDTQGSKKAATEGGSSARNSKWDEGQLNEYEVTSALYDALDHKDAGDDNLIRVGEIPLFIQKLTGIEGDFYLYRDHIYENMVSEKQAIEEGRYTSKTHYHALGMEKMTDAIMSMERPLVAIAAKTSKGNPAISMILPQKGKNGAPLYAVLSFYSKKGINGIFKKRPHIVLTIAERDFTGTLNRDGHAEIIRKAIESGKIISFDKERRAELSVIAQQARLGNITDSTLEKNIAQFQKEIKDFKEENNIRYSQWDEGVSDRELLLDAATEENASDAVLAYARKYKAYEGLLRREERLRARLEASRAAEQKQTGPADNGATEIEEKLRKCREEIARAEMRLAKLEAGAELRREADKAREKWWNRNMAEAVRSNRQIREENTELKSYVEAYRRQMERTKPGEERVRTEDVNRLARALLKEHGSGLDSSYLARRLQKLGDYIVSNNGGEGISYQKLRQEARSLAKEIAENCTVEIDDNRELRKEIRDYLKDTRLQISDELRGDIADFEDFRRSNFGTLRMAKDGRSCSGDENNETHAKIKNGGIKNERTR